MATAPKPVERQAPPLSIVLSSEDEDTATVRVEGELDLSSSPVLERVVEDLCGEVDVVLLDLSGVEFLDVSGYRTLLWLVLAPYGCNDVRICASSPAVCEMVQLVLELD